MVYTYVSFLITHYNRPKSLVNCIASIKEHAKDFNYEIVVSDDCSKPEVIAELKRIEGIELLLADTNKGLAANINKGLNACKGEFLVYIQEDFMLNKAFGPVASKAIETLRQGKLDMVRLRSTTKFAFSKIIDDAIGVIPRYSLGNMLTNHLRYSDHPYLVHSSFYGQFGFYHEGTSTYYGENEYMIRMMKLNPNIGLSITNCITSNELEGSVNESLAKPQGAKKYWKKRLRLLVQNLRFELECIMYNPTKRGLKTYPNRRSK